MKAFVESLSGAEKADFGEFFTKALTMTKATGEEYTAVDALEEAVKNLLEQEISGVDSEGGAEYICQTAKQVIDGDYNSLSVIQAEANEINAKSDK